MRWFVLKDRRYEGPYTKEEIQAEVEKSKISEHDFIISVENRKSNPLAYEKVSDLIGEKYFAPRPKIEKTKKTLPSKEKEALSKEFEESFDSKDLIKSKESLFEDLSDERSPEGVYLEESAKEGQWFWLKKHKSALVTTIAVVFLLFSFSALFFLEEDFKKPASLAPQVSTNAPKNNVKKKEPKRNLRQSQRSQFKLPEIQRREAESVDTNRETVDISGESSFRRARIERNQRRTRQRGARVIADERGRAAGRRMNRDERSYELDDNLENDYESDYDDYDTDDFLDEEDDYEDDDYDDYEDDDYEDDDYYDDE